MSHDPASRVESLLKLAGERDQPSMHSLDRARAAAHASWQRGLQAQAAAREGGQRRWRPRFVWAMSVAAVICASLWLWKGQGPAAEVARVAAVQGDARLDEGAQLTTDARLHAGTALATSQGRVALALSDALSLRMDHDTKLRLAGADQVTLLQGTVYVDSGGLNAHTSLRIRTPAGEVRHVGTQFQVHVRGAHTRIQVREGRVLLQREDAAALDLAAGDRADVSPNQVRVEHGLPGSGAEWEWAAATAPAFDIENRPLSEFLAWLAREHGWQLRYADAATQSRAREIRLHGAMTGLDARGMLERTSLITGVPLLLSEGSLLVGAPR